ncbi:MAG: recombinase family protein [Hyphomicrobiales bacterium]|nr:recombinase family protein [Hyphomicrobiales bacterium]
MTADRPELEKLLATSREGDVVIIPAVDRLSRDTTDLLVIAGELQKAGAGRRSPAEPIVDATSDFAEIVLAALGVAAKLERWRIMERTAVGRADAKAQAVKFGRRQQPIEIFRPPTQLRPQRLRRGPPRATSAPAGAVEPGAAFGAWPRRSFPSAFWYRRVSVV